MQSITNSKAVLGYTDDRISHNEPGFIERGNLYIDGTADGICTGSGGGRAMNFLGNILCTRLNIMEDMNTCNNISGCEWQAETNLFNITISDAGCGGIVNKTYYNITGGINQYCDSYGLQDEGLCNVFRCDWINETELASTGVNDLETRSVSSIWETIKFIALFRADIGLGAFNFIFAFIFFYIPFVMLLWSIYMALPFMH